MQSATSPSSVVSEPKKYIPLSQKLLVGAAAGVVGTATIWPMDLIKSRWMVAKKGQYSSPMDVARFLYHERKNSILQGFYRNRGLAVNLIMVAPEKALKLAVNEKMCEVLHVKATPGKIDPKAGLAGATAGFVQVIVTNPMELMKIHFQLPSKANEAPPTILTLARRLGIRGLYKAVHTTWARDVTFSIIFFPLAAQLREVTLPWKKSDGSPAFFNALVGGTVGGMVAAGTVTPADCVKTHLQKPDPEFTSAMTCARTLYANGGVRALWKGAVPRMIVVGPLFGITLLAFQLQKAIILGEKMS